MGNENLFHISEEAGIKVFVPRPSPSVYKTITGDVVFAISKKLLHNYLFPRDCPRITYYTSDNTSQSDQQKFFGNSSAEFIIAVESKWIERIQQTVLYCYTFPANHFELLDGCAGYYISYKRVNPLSVIKIENPWEELIKQTNIELRILPSIRKLAEEVASSSLHFSLIRMRNAL